MKFQHLAEQNILSLLISREHDERLFGCLYPDIFISSIGRSMFLVLRDAYKNQEQVTGRQIITRAREPNFTYDIYEELKEVEASIDELDLYIQILKEHKAAVKLKDKLKKFYEKSGELSLSDVQTIKRLADEALLRVNLEHESDLELKNSNATLLITNVLSENSERHKSMENSFGCDLTDFLLTKGAKDGYITSIFGPTGGGKSSYAFHLFLGRTFKKLPTLWLSTENDMGMMVERMLACKLEIPVAELQNSDKLPTSDRVKIEKFTQELSALDNYEIHYKPSLSLAKIQEIIRNFELRTSHQRPVVFIDLFTMVKEIKMAKSPKEVEAAVDDLHILANELKVHFVIILQSRRREKSIRQLKLTEIHTMRPSIEEVKHAGAFAERSRVVLSVFNRRYAALQALPEAEEEILATIPNCIEICVAKQNQGVTGEILKYAYEGEIFKLYPYQD